MKQRGQHYIFMNKISTLYRYIVFDNDIFVFIAHVESAHDNTLPLSRYLASTALSGVLLY